MTCFGAGAEAIILHPLRRLRLRSAYGTCEGMDWAQPKFTLRGSVRQPLLHLLNAEKGDATAPPLQKLQSINQA